MALAVRIFHSQHHKARRFRWLLFLAGHLHNLFTGLPAPGRHATTRKGGPAVKVPQASSPTEKRTLFHKSCKPLRIGSLPLTQALVLKCAFSSVQFSRSVVSDSLRPHDSQHARLPCPSPTPGIHSDSLPSSQWCHPAISSSVVPFSRHVYKHKRSQIVKATLKKNSARHIHSLISDYSTKSSKQLGTCTKRHIDHWENGEPRNKPMHLQSTYYVRGRTYVTQKNSLFYTYSWKKLDSYL